MSHRLRTREEIISEFGEPPLCGCPCKQQIPIFPRNYARYKKRGGYPKFINGHHLKGISAWNRNISPSPETIIKMQESHRGERNVNFGKSRSELTKQKIGDAQRGELNHMFGKDPWNKGLTKEIDIRVKIQSEKISGENHPLFGKITRESTREKLRIVMTGELNHAWLGGLSFEIYPQEFNKYLKEDIRGRDSHICQLCGKTQEQELLEYNRILSIHHIDYNKKNNSEKNLITLCSKCHMKTNSYRKYYKQYFYLNN